MKDLYFTGYDCCSRSRPVAAAAIPSRISLTPPASSDATARAMKVSIAVGVVSRNSRPSTCTADNRKAYHVREILLLHLHLLERTSYCSCPFNLEITVWRCVW